MSCDVGDCQTSGDSGVGEVDLARLPHELLLSTVTARLGLVRA